MDNKKRNLKAGGLYIALIVIMFMIGVWGYFASLNRVEDLEKDVSINQIIPEEEANISRAPSPSPSPVVSPAPSAKPTQAPSATPKATQTPKQTSKPTTTPTQSPKKVKMIMPVNGKIIKAFSHDALVYSKTMNDYRTHSGIDIAAPKNERVVAALDGKIEKIYTDDMYGITIEISHDNGLKTVYKNLSTAEMVKEGQKVTQGTPISGVGDTALAEIADESHLHFEVYKDGKVVNPKDYL